jgi:hypothetical protein
VNAPDKFAVYRHRKKDCGEVFYVGRGRIHVNGRCYRAFSSHPRGVFWKRTVSKHGFWSEIVGTFETVEEANIFERALIRHHGRHGLDPHGVLVNYTEGGDGVIGIPRTAEWRQKTANSLRGRKRPPDVANRVAEYHRLPESRERMRQLHTGNTYWLGKSHGFAAREKLRAFHLGRQHSEESKASMSRSHSRTVVDSATGELFLGAQAAANRVGCTRDTLYNWLNGRCPNKSNLRWAS